MIDLKNLSPEEKAIASRYFLSPLDVIEKKIIEYRKANGIPVDDASSSPEAVKQDAEAKKQAMYEHKQEVKQTVESMNSTSMQNIKVQEANTKNIGASAEKIMQQVEAKVNATIAEASSDPVSLRALAESLSCKRLYNKAYKEGASQEDMTAFATELHNRVYPEGIKSVIKQAMQYTSNATIIDGNNTQAIKDALNEHICLILQLSTKGNVTAYIATNNYRMIENLYGNEYYYATMTYAIQHAIDSVKKDKPYKEGAKNPLNLHKVLSGSLRIKPLKQDEYDLSSITYMWNENRTLACMVLDSPKTLGNQLQHSIARVDSIPKHQMLFNMDIYNRIAKDPSYNNLEGCLKDSGCDLEACLDHFIPLYKMMQKAINTGHISDL